jgi:class 3 adenylate cyclase/PAS domain-containing protein
MVAARKNTADELVRAGSLLAREFDFKNLVSTFVDQALDISGSDLAALYLAVEPDKRRSRLRLSYRRGSGEVPANIEAEAAIADFLRDCGESVVMNGGGRSPFADLLLEPSMRSGMALPLVTPRSFIGALFVNSRTVDFYRSGNFNFLNSFASLASGMLHNSRMYKELRDYLNTIEALERYQASVFSSMTNMLVTTERDGRIRYFNEEAARHFALDEGDVGKPVTDFFAKKLDTSVLSSVKGVLESGEEVPGIEGIYRGREGDVDFSLNLSPIGAKRGLHDGITLLFTDQTRERELKAKLNVATEERRVIKDMFSRYLSAEVVQHLIDSPNIVGLGGSDKRATVFFADIRGYTSFSEGRDPQYIITVLNEYFSEAVEIVIRHNGFIDKFIGDCIMAAWGVPMMSEQADAIEAVSCALEIQQLIASKDRKFFRGEAERLKVGFGMHTGHLVAGNLGSLRKMNYSIIGDTVNVAARLEGVAKAGEIIITKDTRDCIGDAFVLEEREPVKVKGKSKEIQIYNVVGKRREVS